MIIDVKPHTPEWHAWRKTGIGASLAPVIMGGSPYQTKRELAERLLGLRDELATNPAMQRGLEFEDEVRQRISDEYHEPFLADVCMARGPLLASLDGITECGSTILEIKLVGEKDFDWVTTNHVLGRHHAQLMQQLYVSRAFKVIYATFTLNKAGDAIDRVQSTIVYPSDSKITEVAKAVTEFWEMIQAKELPAYGPDDRVELDSSDETAALEIRYQYLKDRIEELRTELSEVEQKLWAKVGDHQHARLGVLNFDTYQRQGQVKIQNVPELKDIDLDKHRSKPITVRQIRIKE